MITLKFGVFVSISSGLGTTVLTLMKTSGTSSGVLSAEEVGEGGNVEELSVVLEGVEELEEATAEDDEEMVVSGEVEVL